MPIKLPAPVTDYLAADEQKDLDKLSRCFTKDATVHDENQEYQGLEAIKSWKEQNAAKYHRYVVEPMRAAVTEKNVRLHARLTGDFPGSPAELDYTFVLANGKISSLHIR
ncbi:MAG: polyketide cyclase [Gammaproteobacteria bacterium]|nr:polyketide cyclase [Gammaproteobacteria bacterium]